MQIVIDISEEVYEIAKQDKWKWPADDVYNSIKNGTPLPKGHGRLIDADAFERRCMFDSDIEDMQDVIYALRDYKPIIEADKEQEDGKV